jgi:membrane protease YdiL (CAAX protease family)
MTGPDVVDTTTLLAVDAGFQACGWIACALFCVRLARSGEWREPLARTPRNWVGPSAVEIVLVLLVFLVLSRIAVSLSGATPGALDAEGSAGWHRAVLASDVAKLAVAALSIALLARRGALKAAANAPRFPAKAPAVAIIAAAAAVALCSLQLLAGKIAWRLLDPAAEQPVHAALEALERSAWGEWGRTHLFLAAVIVAPLFEETVFRGLLLSSLLRYLRHAWLAIISSGVAFGLIHTGQPQDVLPLCTLGLILGYVRIRFSSLTIPILVHALFNARTMVLVLLNPELIRMEW